MITDIKEFHFTPEAVKVFLEDAFRTRIAGVRRLRDTLEKFGLPNDIPSIFDRVAKGADFEERRITEEVEAYIKDARLPASMQEASREIARKAVNYAQKEALTDALRCWRDEYTPADFELTDGGEIVFSDTYRRRVYAEKERSMSETDIRQWKRMRLCWTLFSELNEEYDMQRIHSALTFDINARRDIPDERLAELMATNRRE